LAQVTVFDGDPAPPEKRHSPTQFLAHVYCGQMAGWIKMPHGTEVNLGLGDVVLDGVAVSPLPHPKRGTAQVFGPYLLWPNGWMDEDASSYGSRPRPRQHCVRRGPAPQRKGHSSPRLFGLFYCGHGRPSLLQLSSCMKQEGQHPLTGQRTANFRLLANQ